MDILNDALIGHFVSSIVNLLFSSACKFFRKLEKRKITEANDALISHFQQNITSEQGSLSKEEYQKQKRQIVREYDVRPSDLLTIEQLRNKLASELPSASFLSNDQKVNIFRRILDATTNKQGSITIEAAVTLLLFLLFMLGFFAFILQIANHSFDFSAAKVAGFLISFILHLVIVRKKHQ